MSDFGLYRTPLVSLKSVCEGGGSSREASEEEVGAIVPASVLDGPRGWQAG